MDNINRERVISVSLTEAEWQAFLAKQPRPVDWLRDRILDEVAAARREDAARSNLSRQN